MSMTGSDWTLAVDDVLVCYQLALKAKNIFSVCLFFCLARVFLLMWNHGNLDKYLHVCKARQARFYAKKPQQHINQYFAFDVWFICLLCPHPEGHLPLRCHWSASSGTSSPGLYSRSPKCPGKGQNRSKTSRNGLNFRSNFSRARSLF